MLKHVLLILSASTIVACGTKPSATGDDSPDAGDPGADGGVACTTNADCSDGTPICSSGTCVQCETSTDCSGDAPVCSNNVCEASCAGSEAVANLVAVPSDIIFVVDQSGSMDQETSHVQSQINDFVGLISASNIDFRVVMIATTSGENAICVPQPLAGANCGNNTRFRLVDQRIGSRDGPSLATSRYSSYSDFLREDAVKHFVFVTDDNSNITAAAFTTAVDGLLPAGMFTGFKVHGIYAFGDGTSKGCTGAFGTGARDGTVYTQLIAQTSGAAGVICSGDWTQVFQDITEAVVAGSQVSCDLAIPAPPDGETLDPAKVNVRYLTGGAAP